MLRKLLLGGLLLFLMLFGLIACSSDTSDTAESDDSEDTTEESSDEGSSSDDSGDSGSVGGGGVLKVAYSAQPHMLDPHLTTNVATSDIMRHVFETLLTVDSY